MRAPREGETFAGLTVGERLGEGASGVVLAATRPDGSPVALKLLLGHPSPTRLQRFEREARLGETLRHPGIARVLGHGLEGGVPYLILERVEGGVAIDRYVAARDVSSTGVAALMAEVADVVAHAHAAGVIHRDLKPDNVLITADGRVKVIDFGVAREVDAERLTQSGATLGTVTHMAPEQVRGASARADARTDVYALGAILHQLLSGSPPFQGTTVIELMAAVLHDPPPPLPGLEGTPLAAIVTRALSKAPEARHASAAELAQELRELTGGQAGRLVRFGARRLEILAAAGTLLVLLGLGLGFGLRPGAAGPAGPPPAILRASGVTQGIAALLARPAALSDVADVVSSLLAEQAQLEGRGRVPGAAAIADAGHQAEALEGLAALARGERARARARLAELAGGVEGPALEALRGGLAARAGDPLAAERDLTRAIARGVALLDLRLWRAEARLRSSAPDQDAVGADLTAAEQALSLRPRAAELRVRLALAAEDVGDAQRTLAQLPDAPVALRWAVGVAVCDRRLEHDPEAALAALGGLSAAGRPARAARLAARALELLERDLATAGRRVPAALDARLGALLRLATALEGPPPAGLVARLRTRVADPLGAPPAELALALADAFPEDPELQRQIGLLIHRVRDVPARDRFLPVLARAARLQSSPAVAADLTVRRLRLLADRYDRLTTPEVSPADRAVLRRARVDLDAALRAPPRDAVLHGELLAARSRVLRRLGELDPSLRDAQAALRLHDDPNYLVCLGRTQARRGQAAEAQRAFRAFLERAVDNSMQLPFTAARVYAAAIARKDWREALRVTRKLLSLRPDDPGWWVRQARLELELEDAEAAGSLRAAARLLRGGRPAALRVALGRAVRELEAGQTTEARARLRALARGLDGRRDYSGRDLGVARGRR